MSLIYTPMSCALDHLLKRCFLTIFLRDLCKAVNDNERISLAELIIFLTNSIETTGFIDFVHSISPLELDPYMIQDFLVDIMNRQIPQDLVDTVTEIYANMSPKAVQERKEMISVIGASNIIFFEEEDYDDE